jgi:hypothetical protein
MHNQLHTIIAQQRVGDIRRDAAGIHLARHAAASGPRSHRRFATGRIQAMFARLTAPSAHAGI